MAMPAPEAQAPVTPEAGAVYKYVGTDTLDKPDDLDPAVHWLKWVNYSDQTKWQQTNLVAGEHLVAIAVSDANR